MEGIAQNLKFFTAPVAFGVWVLGFWLLKRILVRHLKRWAEKTSARWDDILVNSLSFPLNFLILASGVLIFTRVLPLSFQADRMAATALKACLVFTVLFFLDRLLLALMDHYTDRHVFSHAAQGTMKGIVRCFLVGIGVLILFQLFGISITPILASLGIGSLAVALALQDTLSNFFAGIYIAVDKPLQVGDYVRLESGQEGYVIDIGWRSTRIRSLPNNVVILPNAKLVGSVLTNFHKPDPSVEVAVDASVDYASDLARVERVAREVAVEVLKKIPGAVADFDPSFRYHAFAESGVSFVVVLRAKEFSHGHTLKHEFMKSLHERFKKEGLMMSYPSRTVYLHQ